MYVYSYTIENRALWHERDISHSSNERIIAPDSMIGLDFALNRLTGIVEKGVVILIGATTQNPFFSLNPALLSRSLIFKLEALEISDVVGLLTVQHRIALC